MRQAVLIPIAVLAACSAAASAAAPVKLVDAEQKTQCRFIKFITTRAPSGADAVAAALSKAAGYGANAYYVMNRVDDDAKGATVSGQALACPG